MRKSLVVAAFAALSLSAAPAAAQTLPGYRGDYDAAEAQYRAYAMGEFNEVMTDWLRALNEGDLERALRYYTDDVFSEVEGTARGKEALRPRLATWIEGVDRIQVGMADFEASGRMAVGTLSVVLDSPNGPSESGMLTLVMKSDGRTWRIRTQALVVD